MRLPALVSIAALALSASAAGCIPNDDAQDPSSQNGQQQPGQNGMPPQNGMPQNGQPPMAGQPNNGNFGQFGQQQPVPYNNNPQAAPGQYNPGAAPAAPAGGGGAATPVAPAMAAAATLPLQAMAATQAPGMQPDGGAFAGQFQEGQTLEQPINLQPNKCYTVIATGLGVTEIHIQLVTQPMPGMPPIILAQSAENGPQAVLGGKNCWKFMSPLGAPGKVLVKSHKGGGMVAAQVFIK